MGACSGKDAKAFVAMVYGARDQAVIWAVIIGFLGMGLVFVGLEMRQNTLAIRGQTRNAMAQNAMEYLGWLATTPALTEVEEKVRSVGVDQLTEAEWIQFAAFAGARSWTARGVAEKQP